MPASRRTPPRGSGTRGSQSGTRGPARGGTGERAGGATAWTGDPPRAAAGSGAGAGAGAGAASGAARPRFTGRAAILVLVLAALLVSYASSMRAYLDQRSHITALRASISGSNADIAALRREKQRWDDPAYVEAQARERFGWLPAGEIGYQVIGKDGKPLGRTSTLTDPAAASTVPRPLWWETAWESVVEAGNPRAYARKPAEEIGAPGRSRGGDRGGPSSGPSSGPSTP